MTHPPIELTLGPLYFNWPAAALDDFYAAIADETPIDRVYLGEVVCGKRSPLSDAALARAAERLERGGKTIVWSTLISPVNRRERGLTRDLTAGAELIELNDFGGLGSRKGAEFTAGPFLNIYNEGALAVARRLGCSRWCPPVELSLDAIANIHRSEPDLPIEVFGYGRLPLAHSGRCYHARQHGLNKDSCQYICETDPDGCAVSTLDGVPFLAFNGVQTLSEGLQVCTAAPAVLHEAGIRALRLSPHSVGMVDIARAYRRFLDGDSEAEELVGSVRDASLDLALVNGFLAGQPGREWVTL